MGGAITRAISKAGVFVVLRIEDALLISLVFGSFLKASHWLDALSPPLEQHFLVLAETLRVLYPEVFAASHL